MRYKLTPSTRPVARGKHELIASLGTRGSRIGALRTGQPGCSRDAPARNGQAHTNQRLQQPAALP